MPKAFPLEFRRDVVAVARKGEAPLTQNADPPLDEPRQVTVPAAQFADAGFWRRATATAAEAGHDGHPVMLVGEADPTTVYPSWSGWCETPRVSGVLTC
jgi:hypothetical protein